MGSTGTGHIVLAMFQQSIVVKGIQKKFEELGYTVTIISDELAQRIAGFADEKTLVILYLPGDILDDSAKGKTLEEINRVIVSRKRRMMIIGESRYHDDLMVFHPALRGFTWIDRPIDMDVLERAVAKELSEEESAGRKKRVLIVDDDPSYAKLVRDWIKDDFRCDIVTAGMQAITFLLKIPADDQVDMILLDYEMPVVDGTQVLQMLRQDPATEHIPVVFLTGNSKKEAVAKVMGLKPDGYILKSTTREELLKYLKSSIKK